MNAPHTASLALWPWVRAAEHVGLGVELLARTCYLTESQLRDPAARIPQPQANAVAASVCQRLGAGAPMLAALTVQSGHFQLVEQAVRSAATVADGFDLLVELFPLIHCGGRLEHGRTRSASIVRYADMPGTCMHPAYVELLFAVGLEGIRRETGRVVMPTRVTFTHPSLGEHPLYRQMLGDDIQFGAVTNSFALGVETASLPLLRANPQVREHAAAVASDSVSMFVRDA